MLETVALVVSDELHVTGRPVSTDPRLSRSVAVSCWMLPVPIVTPMGVTDTVETGGGMMIVAVPALPSADAVTVTDPPDRTVDGTETNPVDETVTRVGSDEVQVTVRPESTVSRASKSFAVSCRVAPTLTVSEAGDTSTRLTGLASAVATIVPVADTESTPILKAVTVIVFCPAAGPRRHWPGRRAVPSSAVDAVSMVDEKVLPRYVPPPAVISKRTRALATGRPCASRTTTVGDTGTSYPAKVACPPPPVTLTAVGSVGTKMP